MHLISQLHDIGTTLKFTTISSRQKISKGQPRVNCIIFLVDIQYITVYGIIRLSVGLKLFVSVTFQGGSSDGI